MEPSIYSVQALAERWQVSSSLIHDLIHRGLLPAIKLDDGVYRIKAEAVEEYERKPTPPTNPSAPKPMGQDVYSVAMLAKRWDVSDTFVRDLIDSGRLIAMRLGDRVIRIKRNVVEEYECLVSRGDLENLPAPEQTGLNTGHGASCGMIQRQENDAASRLARLTR